MTDYTNKTYKPTARYNRRPNLMHGFYLAFVVMLVTVYLVVYFADYIDTF